GRFDPAFAVAASAGFVAGGGAVHSQPERCALAGAAAHEALAAMHRRHRLSARLGDLLNDVVVLVAHVEAETEHHRQHEYHPVHTKYIGSQKGGFNIVAISPINPLSWTGPITGPSRR